MAADHPPGFYRPSTVGDLPADDPRSHGSNDAVIATGYAPLSVAERLTLGLERILTGELIQSQFPAIGTDVKVLTTRLGDSYDVLVCVPVVPDRVASHDQYRAELDALRPAVTLAAETALRALAGRRASLCINLNTKDRGESAYLAPFGSSLGKGDIGVVGRGNRYNGLISPARSMNLEAVSGKNPLHHAGKLYNAVADILARRIYAELGVENTTTIVARNGDPLGDPATVAIDVAARHAPAPAILRAMVERELSRLREYSEAFVASDPTERFRNPDVALLPI